MLSFEGLTVLDLYAGSGAFGVEALSRGAMRAVFVEQDRRLVSALKANLTELGVAAPLPLTETTGILVRAAALTLLIEKV